MIPKIIHYCWLGKSQKPIEIQNCILTWKNKLPDYKIVEWNEDNIDVCSIPWVEEAISAKKYAFATDYIRLYALYTYGGIYLDTDVEILKSFDHLLQLPYFIGGEHSIHGINTATIGCVPHLEWIKICMEHYNKRHFVCNGVYDIRVNPELIKESLIKHGYTLNMISSLNDFNYDPNIFNVFPCSWFSPINGNKLLCSDSTVAIHHFNGSWGNKKKGFIFYLKKYLKKYLPNSIVNQILLYKKNKRDRFFDK